MYKAKKSQLKKMQTNLTIDSSLVGGRVLMSNSGLDDAFKKQASKVQIRYDHSCFALQRLQGHISKI